ncbi:response regulator [Phyllobacterium sp. 0TCS1.6C]|uniref:cell cycle histidine kinase CckA n=1 Tax=unclassified Phyllobacterium TaxID=2638441 RepID=UPI002263EDBC|nr:MULTISPECIES: ATP-binding protein [unclassified Phyllobacterium]MCX8279364.1 response regulator [Phyllobacterium sp. 0TCS1.6C]MCX8292445.1 response regulator [Phyllobacterium sp. 0TCS1.6A]
MSQETNSDLYPEPIIAKTKANRAGLRLVLLGALLIGVAVLYFVYRDQLGQPFLLGLLGLLAMIGVFYLFGSAINVIQFTPRGTSDELTRAFVDTYPEGTVVCDQKGRIVYANRAYAQLTGATGADDVRPVEHILSGEAAASDPIYRLANAVRDGIAGQVEIRLSRPLDPAREPVPTWYRVKTRAVAGIPDQTTPVYAWQIADISAERAEQERYFQDIQEAIDHLDHAPAGFFSADPEGRIIYVNATLADWLGIDLTRFTPGSMTVREIVAGNGMALLDAVRTEPGTSRNTVIDLDLATAHGQSLAVRFYHRVQIHRDGRRGPTRTIVLNRAEGEDTSAALRAAEVRFTRFFNSASMAIAAVDATGKILRTNARFLGLFAPVVDRDEIDRRIPLETVVHERDRDAFDRALAAAFAGKAEISPVDTVIPGHEDRHLRFYISPVFDAGAEEGAEEAAIVSVVETTEQKALEATMAQSQKMQAVGQLAGGIAHDFNNVLTAIIMSSDLLLSNHRASDPSFADIMNIKQNANRAASLVRQLLAFSRRQTLRPEVLNLTDVIADVRMLLTRLAGTQVSLKIEHGRDLWPVRADLGQFEQVIVNLTVNARDAMPEGGELTIRTRNMTEAESTELNNRDVLPGEYVVVEVSDTGTGMAPDVIAKIFEPFFTTKEVGKGTGLGLSMVYGIIKQTGGSIHAVSELGKGSTFRILLPRYVEGQPMPQLNAEGETIIIETPKKEKKQDKPKDLSGSATVLLVEDEDAVRIGGLRALQSRGYTVHEASSGVEALEVMKELDGKVDIVVSDVVMPEMDGPTLLRELRKEYGDIKFIFVSGYAEDAFAKNLPEDAKFGFLPKPFSLKQLATAVKEMLEEE